MIRQLGFYESNKTSDVWFISVSWCLCVIESLQIFFSQSSLRIAVFPKKRVIVDFVVLASKLKIQKLVYCDRIYQMILETHFLVKNIVLRDWTWTWISQKKLDHYLAKYTWSQWNQSFNRVGRLWHIQKLLVETGS